MADGPKLTIAGKLIILLFIGGCFLGAWWLFFMHKPTGAGEGGAAGGQTTSGAGPRASSTPPAAGTTIGIAYGTEKKRWMEWALERYRGTPNGANVQVELIPMGSLEGAQAILGGNKKIHVWSPASALYKDVFIQEWQVKFGGDPIGKQEALALTPMVIVSWDVRHQAFLQKYGKMTFDTISQALREKGGWDAIAQKPEWGLFKFGHTHPNQSNSGLMTLVLLAYSHARKTRGLELKDIVDVNFQNWMQDFERGVTGLPNSTGNMMREMVLKGPSSYDAVCVYENVAIDYLKNAEGRWGELRITYPGINMWNENPYYILNVPWMTPDQRRASESFLEFLLSEAIQKEALVHGFRPGNPSISIKSPDSPFVLYTKSGLQVDLTTMCEPPKAEVLNNLLVSWQRSQGNR
jgi:hypothetical protein